MDEPPKPSRPGNETGTGILWLAIGLAPTVVLLSVMTPDFPGSTSSHVIILLCAICNLAGGIGCLSGREDKIGQIVLGTVLGGVFFALSWIIALFQACSNQHL